ncbi:MAG: type II toxin-antitoxin system VapC family toxin [Gaiella sp.]|nr:type II toxin-antitoxin system VapC family toxin [Gaiella sp.]
MTYLVDTNVLSEVRKPGRHAGVAAWLGSLSERDMYVSVLVFGEIRRGIERLQGRDAPQANVFERWLEDLRGQFDDRVLPVDTVVAEAWGRISAQGPVPTVDGLMAATALVNGLTVVTRDTAPFERVGVPCLDPWTYGEP